MTQAMQQSLKILQMSTNDLQSLVEEELEINPLLEKQENSEEVKENNDNSDQESKLEVGLEEEFKRNKDNNTNDVDEDNFSDSWNTSDSYSPKETDFSKGEQKGALEVLEKTYMKEVSLEEHLLEQINLDFKTPKQKIIAAHLTEMLDSNGFLKAENLEEELKRLADRIGGNASEIKEVISQLQTLDPLGVFSQNLQECLKIQLKEKDRLDPAMNKLVNNLDILAKGDFKKLMRICNVDEEDLREMIIEIKALNPRPASNFSTELVQTKVPDLYLKLEEGEYNLEVNNEVLPKIFIKEDFVNKLKASKQEGDKKFITEKISSGNFLIRAMAQRFETMLKVANIIVDKQKEFFDKGVNYLKPITMKDIAIIAEIHESTVGRVVANKYISTPRGVFELRYFFTQGLSSSKNTGDVVSSESIKYKIKDLIENEKEVLSDEDLSLLLKRDGVTIARRTVAKYREAIGIPTSSKRKRLRKLNMGL